MGSDLNMTGVSSGTFPRMKGSAFGFAVSAETDAEIDRLAHAIGGSKEDVFSRALALLKLAVEAKTRGKRVAIIDAEDHIDTEITGI